MWYYDGTIHPLPKWLHNESLIFCCKKLSPVTNAKKDVMILSFFYLMIQQAVANNTFN